jgi:hypothetical protein
LPCLGDAEELRDEKSTHHSSLSVSYVDAHEGGGRGEGEGEGTSCTPSKDLEKLGHTNAIKQKNRSSPRFSHNPPCTPSKSFENDFRNTRDPLLSKNVVSVKKYIVKSN